MRMSLRENWSETSMLKDLWDDPKYNPEEDPLILSAINAVATAIDGLDAAKAPDDYLEITLYPGSEKDKEMRREVLGMSGCALTTSGLWRALGIGDEVIWKPYRISKAVSDVVTVAKAHNVWIIPREDDPSYPNVIKSGDVLLVASPEHVFTVLGEPVWDEEKKTLGFAALHGGQLDDHGNQLIRRAWTEATWITKDMLKVGKRRVMGIARTRQMRPTKKALLPPGWLESGR